MSRAPGLTVGIISLGCAKNLVDSEVMAAAIRANGFRLAPSADHADVVLVNTCAFIRDAREESVDAVLEACALKGKDRCRAVVVTGCLPQRYREQLQRAIPEVDAFLGLDELDQVGAILARVAAGERGIMAVSRTAVRVFEPPAARPVFTGGPFAYVKVAEGCNHRCGYCAIPLIRGRHRSRPVARIVAEAERLLAAGVRELNLISQDTTSYGRDRDDGSDLCALLRALGALGGRFWIRVLYGYPPNVTHELLDTMGEVTQVCRYLDLPIQHSHPDLLRAMLRANTVRAVEGMADRIRARLPGVVLRTTCLVGYPGETRTHFAHLLAYVRQAQFDHLGVFAFSPEENTPAAGLPSQVPARTAARRRAALLIAQQNVVRHKARERVGKKAEILLESKVLRGSAWCGRSRGQAPEVDGVTFVSGVSVRAAAGDFVLVEYTGHRGYDLRAQRVSTEA